MSACYYFNTKSKHRTHAAMFIKKIKLISKIIGSMYLKLEMVDMETNELLAHRYCQYELNFDNKDDRGFQTLVSWCRSCVRGIRLKHMPAIELRVQFIGEITQEDLFGGISREEFNKKAGAFLV